MPEDRSRPPTALDRALDAALADLTSAAAPRDLRRRVLARVSADDARPRPSGFPVRWAVALPAAAALALVVAGGWLTRRTGGPAPREAPRPVAAVSPAPSAVSPAAQPPSRRVAPPVPRRVARAAQYGRPAGQPPGPVARTAPMHPGGDEPPGLPPLEPPASLRVAELDPAEMPEPPSIEVPALRIEPLADREDGGLGLP